MHTVTNLDDLKPNVPTVLTIGKFDGVHLGHQHLIRQINQRARALGGQSAALFLHPHPQEVLAPHRPVEYITSLEERLDLMAGLGLDLAIVLEFTREVASTPARDFVEELLRHIRLAELWVGPNFALGRGREGNVPFLQNLAQELGFKVEIAPMLAAEGLTISSSQIRELIQAGQVEEAAVLLGRAPGVRSQVVVGAQRGRSLGFPTANLAILPKHLIPANGVYAVRVRLSDDEARSAGDRRVLDPLFLTRVHGAEVLDGVANVGVRPSFDNGQRTVEVYIFDFDRDIYGYEIEVQFVARLRDERKFAHIDELKAQIRRDVEQARAILSLRAETSLAAAAMPKRYEEVEHTADIAIRAYGRDLPELFANAAYGMFDLMADIDRPALGGADGLAPAVRREFELQAIDVETLLIDWLNALLYEHEMRGEVYNRFEVREAMPQHLAATVFGTNNIKPHRLIKAVTFHDLQVEQTPDGYTAKIVFDV